MPAPHELTIFTSSQRTEKLKSLSIPAATSEHLQDATEHFEGSDYGAGGIDRLFSFSSVPAELDCYFSSLSSAAIPVSFVRIRTTFSTS